MTGGFRDGAADGREPWTGDEAVAIKLIEKFCAAAGEEHLHGFLFAAHDGAEFGTGRAAEQSLRQMAGVFPDANT